MSKCISTQKKIYVYIFTYFYSLSNRTLLILIIIYSLVLFDKVLELYPEEKGHERGKMHWWTNFTSMWLHSPYA